MERIDIINCVGREFLTQNIENGEFSYKQVLDDEVVGHFKLDLRFYDSKNKVAVLIETKKKFVKKDKEQLFAYVALEQRLSPQAKIIAILANTSNNNIKVWKVGEYEEELDDTKLKSMSEYVEYFKPHSILPYINDASYEGHDILSYFFTTFNKYVAREDKNQAFTPNHISHFMCKVAGIHRNTRVLDPTCGSGTFLVQAMTQILRECETDAERKKVKEQQIYGIEFDDNVYGLATTNMLIHGDGNSNIRYKSCFDLGDWMTDTQTNLVLMNPPYNASKNQVPKTFANTWGKSSTDPSKGLYFVKFVADKVKQGRLLVLLPMQCAIKTDGLIGDIKQSMLEEHTLDAVFSFPIDMFYPGASAVACCMVFDLGKPHPKDYETFFGYYREDGFEKRKGIGRVDVKDKWEETEKKWYDTYRSRLTIPGLSVCKSVTPNMEWCAEAYMETDYSSICANDFIEKMQAYAAFLIQNEK